MPKRVDWRVKALEIDSVLAEKVLAELKSHDVSHSQTMACSLCPDAPHKMRYRLLKCSSSRCEEASWEACSWRGKTLTCLETGVQSFFDFGEHTSSVSSPKKKRLTPAQKAFCREMATHHLRPLRIRNALARKFDTPLEDVPSLSTVQNFVNYYSRKYLDNHDRVDTIKAWIHSHAFNGSETQNQPFTFGWDTDVDGNLVVGNGSGQEPFIVGITTKALLLRMNRPPESFVFHIDNTYKTNQCDYPVMVLGISDSSRAFHLVALFVVSQETQPIFEAALLSLGRIYNWVTEKALEVRYAMADADQAQFNALRSVFSGSGNFYFLMCFFHFMENVHKAIKGFPSVVASMIVRDIYDLHFARSWEAFVRLRDGIVRRWFTDYALVGFTKYMCGQWLYGPFSCWQAFTTPCGYATTNNPAETFNASLKRDYTLRRRLKMGALLHELSSCCASTSESPKTFMTTPVPASTLTRRAQDMKRAGLLYMSEGQDSGFTCTGAPQVVRVLSMRPPRITVAPNKRTEVGIAVSAQMGSNYARMEVEGQPWGGWPVDVQQQWCPCNYWFAFGACVHVIFALRSSAHVDSSGHEVLVSKRKRKNRSGRPRDIGPALSYD